MSAQHGTKPTNLNIPVHNSERLHVIEGDAMETLRRWRQASATYIRIKELKRENVLLKNEVKLMQESLQKAYIRIKELIEKKDK